jgi:hypothetical protein
LLVVSSGRGSPMISAWRTSRSVRISSTDHSLFRPGPPPYLADLTPRRTARFLTLRIAFIEAWQRPFPPVKLKLFGNFRSPAFYPQCKTHILNRRFPPPWSIDEH